MNERIEVKIELNDLYQLKSTINLLTTMNQNLVADRKRASHLMGKLVGKIEKEAPGVATIVSELSSILNPDDESDAILDIDVDEGGYD